jgi:hypothetical protein
MRVKRIVLVTKESEDGTRELCGETGELIYIATSYCGAHDRTISWEREVYGLAV